METHKDLALALDKARKDAGLSYSAVVRGLYDRLGVYALATSEGVRNYHRPETFPAKPDLLQIIALADIYDVDIETLSPEAGVILARLRDSVRRDACSGSLV